MIQVQKIENLAISKLIERLEELKMEIEQQHIKIECANGRIQIAEDEKAQIVEVIEAYRKVMS